MVIGFIGLLSFLSADIFFIHPEPSYKMCHLPGFCPKIHHFGSNVIAKDDDLLKDDHQDPIKAMHMCEGPLSQSIALSYESTEHIYACIHACTASIIL